MNDSLIRETCSGIVPVNYLNIGLDARKAREKIFRLLLEKKKLPEEGWEREDDMIEEFINYISSLDSNNFPNTCGVGEREARVYCKLVSKRHYNFGHGIGRSGDLLEPQPKAAGSTLLSQLTNSLVLDLIKTVGINNAKSCFIIPLATGMTINLCFQTLKKKRPHAKYVLWSRIDQKSCFKSMTTAGLIPVVISPICTANGLSTDVSEFKRQLENLGHENVLCIFSTTSCFAPRLCDDVIELAKIAKSYSLPHIVNNAYGLQSTFLTHQIEQASRLGNVDIFVQSTDKNLMVPVGGAIVAGFDEEIVRDVAKSYVGRASSSQTLDVLMTLLALGRNKYKELLNERKETFEYLQQQLKKLAIKHGETVYETRRNPISLALTLTSISDNNSLTKLGSMLFTRGVSGARVISLTDTKTIDGYKFEGWGSHTSNTPTPYITAAASLGVKSKEVDVFIEKLDKCMEKIKNMEINSFPLE